MDKKKNKLKVRVKPKEEKCMAELHIFLDLLCASKYYGAITLYFQNGSFEYIKGLSSISKTDLVNAIKDTNKEYESGKNKAFLEDITTKSELRNFLILNSIMKGFK